MKTRLRARRNVQEKNERFNSIYSYSTSLILKNTIRTIHKSLYKMRGDRQPLPFSSPGCKKKKVKLQLPGQFHRLVHFIRRNRSSAKRKKKKKRASALVARVRADHAHLRHVVVLVRPLQERVGEPQSRDALK